MKLHNQFVKLLIQIKSENEFLFVPLKPTETIDHVDYKKFGKKLARALPKQHGFINMTIKSTLYRKLMASVWKEKIRSNLKRGTQQTYRPRSCNY